MVWSVWHQFNDVQDFFPIPTIVRERKWKPSRTPQHLRSLDVLLSRRPLSLCCWLHTHERGDAARLHSMRMFWQKWTRVWDVLEVTTLFCVKAWAFMKAWTAALEDYHFLASLLSPFSFFFIPCHTLCGLYASGLILIFTVQLLFVLHSTLQSYPVHTICFVQDALAHFKRWLFSKVTPLPVKHWTFDSRWAFSARRQQSSHFIIILAMVCIQFWDIRVVEKR